MEERATGDGDDGGEDLMHRFAFRVRYGDTDWMGFAYYANHLRWFEIGRAEMLRDLGMSYRVVEDELGVSLPVLTAHCDYRNAARYDDPLVVETTLASLRRASVRFHYRVAHEDGTPIATGWTEHCFLGRDGRPTRIPDALRVLLERVLSADAARGGPADD
jgi:acyl-CoA thioester hydrolase